MYINAIYGEIAKDVHVETTKPLDSLTAELTAFVDSIPDHDQFKEGEKLFAAVNKAMFENAIDSVIYSTDIFAELAKIVTYGRYTIKEGETGGYAYGSETTVERRVEVGTKDGKKVYETRPAFIDYAQVAKRYKAIKAECKKAETLPPVLHGDFTTAEKLLVSLFIANVMDKPLTETDKARLANCGDEFARFADNSNTAIFDQLTHLYNLFNKRTGLDIKPITKLIDPIRAELRKVNSKFYTETVGNETACIAILFNHYINSGIKKYGGMTEIYKAMTVDKVLTVANSENK